MIVVDSSVWIDQLRGIRTRRTDALADRVRGREVIGITDVVYMELLRGARSNAESAAIRLRIDQVQILRLRELEDFELSAALYQRARQAGHTIRQATDCMIAAVCIRESLPILHDDLDFDRIAEVSELLIVAA
jgi:predicted nucleic acid-binding protein